MSAKYVCVCVRACMCVCACTCMFAFVCTYMCVYACVCMCVYAFLYYLQKRGKEERSIFNVNMWFQGETNRAIAAHSLNRMSSRSHCIFTVYLEVRFLTHMKNKWAYVKISVRQTSLLFRHPGVPDVAIFLATNTSQTLHNDSAELYPLQYFFRPSPQFKVTALQNLKIVFLGKFW